ncbi:MAG: hypothetical protein CMP23_08480 [Rickettsiales bacterium]|nr:hypothetical protein [Rickettsiales bacterium]
MTPGRIAKLLLALVLLAPLGLFYLQNAGTRVDLVFRLPGVAWYLVRGASIPLLLFGSLVSGLLLSGIWFGGKAVARGRAVRSLSVQIAALEDELALARVERNSASPSSIEAPGSSTPATEETTDFDELI